MWGVGPLPSCCVPPLADHTSPPPKVTLHCADALAELSNDEAVAPMVLSTEGVLEGMTWPWCLVGPRILVASWSHRCHPSASLSLYPDCFP